MTTTSALGANSEVGQLGTVLLHRPGDELRRLTPRNNDSLLFDGIPWVGRAQDEHDAFADALRTHGVEVLYLVELLTETLESDTARAVAVDQVTATLETFTPSHAHLPRSLNMLMTATTRVIVD